MKGGQKLSEAQTEYNLIANWIRPQNCHVCQKSLKYPYGRHMVNDKEEWTCNSKCEKDFYASLLRSSSQTA